MQTSFERASADDCAVIAEVGKRELNWSATNAPQAFFYPRYDVPGGGAYLEDCSWGELGLAAPPIGRADSPMGFIITRPVYTASGASTYFQYSVVAIPADNGKQISPFLERKLCTLEKRAGGWHLIGCKLNVVM